MVKVKELNHVILESLESVCGLFLQMLSMRLIEAEGFLTVKSLLLSLCRLSIFWLYYKVLETRLFLCVDEPSELRINEPL